MKVIIAFFMIFGCWASAEAVIKVNPDGSYIVDKGGVCVDLGVE